MTYLPKHVTHPYTCKFCGQPSLIEPRDQVPPPDYCHESDHGDDDLYYTAAEMDDMFFQWKLNHPGDVNAGTLQQGPPS